MLNSGRHDPPDIDIDFPWDERDRVLDFVFAQYGASRVAMVTNHNTLGVRAAIREVAKVYGMSVAEMNRLRSGVRSCNNTSTAGVPTRPRCTRWSKTMSRPSLAKSSAKLGRARLSWARLLKRVFAIDMAACPQCGSPLTLIAAIEDPGVIAKSLAHLGLPTRAPTPQFVQVVKALLHSYT